MKKLTVRDLIWSASDKTCTFGDCRIEFHNKDLYNNGYLYHIIGIFIPKYSSNCTIIIDDDDKGSPLYKVMIYSGDTKFSEDIAHFFYHMKGIYPHKCGRQTNAEYNFLANKEEIEIFVKNLYQNMLKFNSDLNKLSYSFRAHIY